MSSEWYLMSNKHLSGFEKEQLEKSYGVFDELLAQSPESYSVTVNNASLDVIVQSTSDPLKRSILFKEGTVTWGDIVTHESQKWLVTDRPFNNRIYEKSKMSLCGNTMVFTVESNGTISGYDNYGNPIYSTEPTETTVDFPCVIEDISSLQTPTGEKINLSEGDMAIQIPYTTDSLIALDSEFEMFGDMYRITGIDKSMVLNNNGILLLVTTKTDKTK